MAPEESPLERLLTANTMRRSCSLPSSLQLTGQTVARSGRWAGAGGL